MRRAGDRLRGQGPVPLPHRQRRGLKIAAAIAAIAAILIGGYFLARQVYFLGTDEDGRVALYQGLPYDLPFGIELYSEERSIRVEAASLSTERREVVTEHKPRSEDDASDIIDDIEQREGVGGSRRDPGAKAGTGQGQAGTGRQGQGGPGFQAEAATARRPGLGEVGMNTHRFLIYSGRSLAEMPG